MLVATILFGTIYLVAMQLDRASANDAPLRLASQVATELREGQQATLQAQPHVDLSSSLAPFVVLEDAQGSPTAGSGFLKGKLVSLPTGVLTSAASKSTEADGGAGAGADSVTWQPTSTLRFATVTFKVGDQFVTAGQSLAPSDDLDTALGILTALGWIVSMLVLAGSWYWSYRTSSSRVGSLEVSRESQPDSGELSPAPHSSE
jgi:hypothetical protein